MDSRSPARSIPDLLGDLFAQLPRLVRQEGQLARAELSEQLTRLGMAIGLMLAGAVLLIPALVVLLQAGVAALVQAGWQPSTAALMAGGAALLIGLVLLLIGVKRVRAGTFVPQRTIHQLQEDASVAKRQVRSDYESQRAA
jgi:membrane protein implicated in regulation of membrane protease activity